MSTFERLSAYRPYGLAALRIMTALLFIEHGMMKLFGFPAAQGDGPLPTLFVVAGLLELVGGLLVLIGFATRPVAFLLAGEMAIAYFMAHMPRSFFPAINQGDAAILFCFVFLYIFFAGAGAWSVDNRNAAA
ncbi:putative oxidoreductase [Rhizobium sp. BK529]|uniref:DoxX family protein n=1 Tax=unclassified Rhizobium TaxID=2613769 RepID=UPI00104B53F1|nr:MULTISPECIES: DoxX family protein [unclassified Rhizobium]MBB3591167.1 putative oxidoreductase [Rhizobium sp. BK529]TCS08878.1 putative oxidoreductase [Rhizobium sp. BK418]